MYYIVMLLVGTMVKYWDIVKMNFIVVILLRIDFVTVILKDILFLCRINVQYGLICDYYYDVLHHCYEMEWIAINLEGLIGGSIMLD